MQESKLTSKDNLKLSTVKWTVEKPKLKICLIHGHGEHVKRYDHVAQMYNSHGVSVYGMDLRGHGTSDGSRGHAPSLDAYFDDIDMLVAEVKADNPSIPWLIYGHSMGGNLVLNYVIRRNPDCNGVLVTAPWIKIKNEPSKFLIMAGKLLNNFGGFTQATGLDPNGISTDSKEVEIYLNDPLIHDKISSKAGLALHFGAEYLFEYQGGVKQSCLLLHAKKDELTLAQGTEMFARNNPENTTLKLYDDMLHEMHYDVHRERLFEDCITWINKNVVNLS